jgi:hypothetical protein
MNKLKKIYTMLLLFSAVGILYSIFILKGIPETFDWNLEEDEDENY